MLKKPTNLKEFQPEEEDFSLKRVVRFSSLFSSQNHSENATESTADTSVDAMSAMSPEQSRNDRGTNKIANVQFDFDPGLGLNRNCEIQPNKEIRGHEERDTIPTDLGVQKENKSNNQMYRPYHVDYIEENHNQYIARKFDRRRINFYLDLLCPSDDIVEEDSYQEQMHAPKKEINRSRSASEESNSKLTKSFEGFSLEAAELNDPSKGGDFTDLKQHEGEKLNYSDFSARLDAIIRKGMSGKVPSSIDINVTNDSDDEITLNSFKDEPQSQMMIPHSDTHDARNSPTGIEEFDFTNQQDPKLLTRWNSADHVQFTPNNNSSTMYYNEPKLYYQPMATSNRPNSARMIQNSKARVDHLRTRMDNIAKSSSYLSPSVKSFCSPVTYSSANIAKIKSRMRLIESQYNELKVLTVQDN